MNYLKLILLISLILPKSIFSLELKVVNVLKVPIKTILFTGYSSKENLIYLSDYTSKSFYSYEFKDSTIKEYDVNKLITPLMNRETFELLTLARLKDPANLTDFIIDNSTNDVYVTAYYLDLIKFVTVLNKGKLDSTMHLGHNQMLINLTNKNENVVHKFHNESIFSGCPSFILQPKLISSNRNENFLYLYDKVKDESTSLMSSKELSLKWGIKVDEERAHRTQYVSDTSIVCFSYGSCKPFLLNVGSKTIQKIDNNTLDSCFPPIWKDFKGKINFNGVQNIKNKIVFAINIKNDDMKLFNCKLVITELNLTKIKEIDINLAHLNLDRFILVNGNDGNNLYFIGFKDEKMILYSLDVKNELQ